jgi:hypothetical protein
MNTKTSKRIAHFLVLAAVGLSVSGCIGPFADERRVEPTVYQDPGVANTPAYSGNPPYVLNPYTPTADVSPTP